MEKLTGQSLGRYHILEQLGEGGMATVYKAYDTRLEREVAVKIIRRGAFPPEHLDRILKRFEREAKSLAKLSHPNIVGVIDYGDYEGSPYLVMEYLPGGTLKQRLGKPMPWQEATRLLLPVARALQFAHAQGILHRDVKPSNILITLSGEPMLSDFGIAKLLESEDAQTLTGTGIGVGTPEYMAPEQWTGHVTSRSDVYSLGVVLYELVTGRKPYMADTPAAILLKQATEALPRPVKFVPDLPEVVEKVLLKALARNHEDRYADMAALGNALESLLIGKPLHVEQAATMSAVPNRQMSKAGAIVSRGMEDSQSTIDQGAIKEAAVQRVKQESPPPALGNSTPPAAQSTRTGMFGRCLGVELVLGGIVLIILFISLGKLVLGAQKTPMAIPTEKSADTPSSLATSTQTMTPFHVFIPTILPISTSTQTQTLSAPFAYNVQAGDSLYSIAEKFNLGQNGVVLILMFNPYDPNKRSGIDPVTGNIYPGQSIIVPPSGMPLPTPTPWPTNAAPGTRISYFVLPGDSLGSIAIKFNSTVDAIIRVNRLLLTNGYSSVMYPGWILIVPVNLVPNPTPSS